MTQLLRCWADIKGPDETLVLWLPNSSSLWYWEEEVPAWMYVEKVRVYNTQQGMRLTVW